MARRIKQPTERTLIVVLSGCFEYPSSATVRQALVSVLAPAARRRVRMAVESIGDNGNSPAPSVGSFRSRIKTKARRVPGMGATGDGD